MLKEQIKKVVNLTDDWSQQVECSNLSEKKWDMRIYYLMGQGTLKKY